MADDEADARLQRPALEVTFDEFKDYCAEKNIITHCPMCKKIDWQTAIGQNEKFPLQLYGMPPAPSGPIEYSLVFEMACRNCGFICHFQANPVLDWKARRGK